MTAAAILADAASTSPDRARLNARIETIQDVRRPPPAANGSNRTDKSVLAGRAGQRVGRDTARQSRRNARWPFSATCLPFPNPASAPDSVGRA
jgi:hypothetical protein